MSAILNGQPIISGAMTADVTSQPTDLSKYADASYEIEFTGTPTGTFSIQVTNHWDVRTDPTGTAFKTLTLASPIAAATGAAGDRIVDLSSLPFRWVRLKYTFAAGTGTLNTWVAGKAA
jgi:hypothetical protein